MKKLYITTFSILVILLLCCETVYSCSIEIPPLRKDFRKAASVFVGKVTNIRDHKLSESEKTSIPEHWRNWNIFSKVTFNVEKKWKGSSTRRNEFIAVAYFNCGCPGSPMNQFEEGKEFLVFARSKNFVNICESDKIGSEYVADKMKRLDNFLFRSWAVIYPF